MYFIALIKLLLLLLLHSHCFPICWRSDVFGALAVVSSWFYRKLARSKAEKYPDSLEELFTLQNIAKLRVIGYKVFLALRVQTQNCPSPDVFISDSKILKITSSVNVAPASPSLEMVHLFTGMRVCSIHVERFAANTKSNVTRERHLTLSLRYYCFAQYFR